MREDFDFVSMQNYQSDMDELARQAAAVVQHMQREIREKDAIIWAMVRASGGKATIQRLDLVYGKPKQGKIESNIADDSITFEIGT